MYIYPRLRCQFITYSIKTGNLDLYKCGHCKNEAREIHCLCCKEVDAMLIALAKIPEHGISISSSSFYVQLRDYSKSNVLPYCF